MRIQYDVEKLNQIIADFYHVTGISIALLDRECQEITDYAEVRQPYCVLLNSDGRTGCKNADRMILRQCEKAQKPVIHTCYAGLLDAALPIMVKGEVVGYIIMGQVRKAEDFSVIEKQLPQALIPQLRESYAQLPLYSLEQMESATRIVGAMITRIIEEEMILITSEELATLAGEYIAEHLNEPLNIEGLCRIFSVSKNRLYQCFHQYYNNTVSGYITEKRMEKAMELLRKNKDAIEVIAEKVGYGDSSYFYKVFKKEIGKTPRIYRKESV